MDAELIKSKLNAFNVPIFKWGTGESEPFDHLVLEENNGFARIVAAGENLLVREIHAVTIKIYYMDQETGKEYYLVEEKQVLADGSEKPRVRESSIATKMRLNSIPMEVMKEALRDEVGLSLVGATGTYMGENIREADSGRYPGLKTRYYLSDFLVHLGEDQFNPDGYVKQNGDVTNHFIWKEVPPSQNE